MHVGRKRITKGANLCARLGDSTEVVDHIGLGHTDTSITDGEDLVLLVGGDTNVEILLGVELGGVGKRGIADFVEGIGAVRDKFSKENLLVRVESVWKGKVRKIVKEKKKPTY